mmetsp:Transcript_32068/g.63568  ORF Transcript_32068/g.63568 Transcript_32068/m.63568 type:complete len:202 (-) Transcript_32068:2255-2860(-)
MNARVASDCTHTKALGGPLPSRPFCLCSYDQFSMRKEGQCLHPSSSLRLSTANMTLGLCPFDLSLSPPPSLVGILHRFVCPCGGAACMLANTEREKKRGGVDGRRGGVGSLGFSFAPAPCSSLPAPSPFSLSAPFTLFSVWSADARMHSGRHSRSLPVQNSAACLLLLSSFLLAAIPRFLDICCSQDFCLSTNQSINQFID